MWTDRQTWLSNFSRFRNFAKAPKNKEERFGDISRNMIEEAELARNFRQIAVF
jgi:hypothetical protein